MKSLFKLMPAVSGAVFLSGCLSGVEKPTGDTTNAFDGVWSLSWKTEQLYQQSGTWRFVCSDESGGAQFFIENGEFGLPNREVKYGRVDHKGVLLARIPIGTFNVHGDNDKKADLVVSGSLQGDRGEGLVIHAMEYTIHGCRGQAYFSKIDTDITPDSKKIIAMPVEVKTDGQMAGKGAIYTLSPFDVPVANFKLEYNGRVCYGQWFTEKNSTSGDWAADCDNRSRMRGQWKFNGVKWGFSGTFDDKTSVSIDGTLVN